MALCQPNTDRQFNQAMTPLASSYSRRCVAAYINNVPKKYDCYHNFRRCGNYCMIWHQTRSRSLRPANFSGVVSIHQRLDWFFTDLQTIWNNPGGPSAQQGSNSFFNSEISPSPRRTAHSRLRFLLMKDSVCDYSSFCIRKFDVLNQF